LVYYCLGRKWRSVRDEISMKIHSACLNDAR
jgi:hypothetical protein